MPNAPGPQTLTEKENLNDQHYCHRSYRTIIAKYGDARERACGDQSDLGGFYPCDPTGREVEPNPKSSWDVKLLYCADCGLGMDQSTYDSTTQTVAVLGRIQTITTSKHGNSRVTLHAPQLASSPAVSSVWVPTTTS
jgi:hypothetical protein